MIQRLQSGATGQCLFHWRPWLLKPILTTKLNLTMATLKSRRNVNLSSQYLFEFVIFDIPFLFCFFFSAENPYAKVKRTDTMESETAEADDNETDTDNYDVVDTLHTVDETTGKTKSPEASGHGGDLGAPSASSLIPPPLPLPLRGSHSSLASGGDSSTGHHGPRPPPRGRRVSGIAGSHSGSRPGSMVLNEQDARDMAAGADATDGSAADEGLLDPLVEQGAGAGQIHFSGDSQTSQDSSESFSFYFINISH